MTQPNSWPVFDEDAIQAVADILRSGKVNQWTGDQVATFERDYAAYVGVEHAVALANGTVALELALHALDIQPGNEVIVPCRTFLATATAVIMRNAIPVFADVAPDSQVLTVETVDAARTPATRAVIAVHLAGWPCEMQELREYCDSNGLLLIEDCAQAHGARIHDVPVGRLGDAAGFSFCQDKIITTGGEGGMLLTPSEEVFKKAWSFKDHGRDYDLVFHTQHAAGFRWLNTSIGTNWRLTEIQAALGLHQLRKLDQSVKLRRRNADILRDGLAATATLYIPPVPTHVYHSYYKFYCFVQPAALKEDWCRDRIVHRLNEQGVAAIGGICPEIYRERAFETVRFPDGSVRNLRPAQRLPIARELGETSVMLQVHPTLSPDDMQRSVEAITTVCNEAQR